MFRMGMIVQKTDTAFFHPGKNNFEITRVRLSIHGDLMVQSFFILDMLNRKRFYINKPQLFNLPPSRNTTGHSGFRIFD